MNIGFSLFEVNDMLKESQFTSPRSCYICSSTAKYKLIPKHAKFNSAEVEDKGYVCANCLQCGKVDNDKYGIRELQR